MCHELDGQQLVLVVCQKDLVLVQLDVEGAPLNFVFKKQNMLDKRKSSPPPDARKKPKVLDYDKERAMERMKQLEQSEVVLKPSKDPQVEQEILALTTRTGGAYIPPARLRAMQSQLTNKSSEAYQRMSWESLKKSINGLINKVCLRALC